MSESGERWSPARHPYAIAVSQAWWTFRAVCVFARDAKSGRGEEQQIYARQLFGQFRALRRCADMQARELKRLGVDDVHRDRLDVEIADFDAAVPAAKPGRDILEHFDAYARGEGILAKKAMDELGLDEYEAAAIFWGGGYDPETETIAEGPFVLDIPVALNAAERLYLSIYAAGKAVDHASPRSADLQEPYGRGRAPSSGPGQDRSARMSLDGRDLTPEANVLIAEALAPHYVYLLVDPENNEIFYVGKGTGLRYAAHFEDTLVGDDDKPRAVAGEKAARIAAIRRRGQRPEVTFVRRKIRTEPEAHLVEAALIDVLREHGASGV